MNKQLDLPYPGTPGYKERGGTSELAATDIKERACKLRDRVLAILKIKSCTADEVAEIMDEDILSIRPRFSELKTMKRIRKTGERRPSSRGKSSVVWEVVR